MKKNSKVMAVILMLTLIASTLVPMQAKADSTYPNNVTTHIGHPLTSTVDVNYHAGTIMGLVGQSPLADFWTAAGLTEEDITNNYHPVVYVNDSSFGQDTANELRDKAIEIGAEPVISFVDIYLFKQTTESTFISSYPNYVQYTLKIPDSVYSSEFEFALISHQGGRMRLFKDLDDDYTTLTFSTNISASYALVRAWDGTFDNIENGAYIDGTVDTTASTTATSDDADLDDVPKTGQSNVIVFFAIAALVSGGYYLYINKKEKAI
jgi:LPXTG-motif cell wall-anchored protein